MAQLRTEHEEQFLSTFLALREGQTSIDFSFRAYSTCQLRGVNKLNIVLNRIMYGVDKQKHDLF